MGPFGTDHSAPVVSSCLPTTGRPRPVHHEQSGSSTKHPSTEGTGTTTKQSHEKKFAIVSHHNYASRPHQKVSPNDSTPTDVFSDTGTTTTGSASMLLPTQSHPSTYTTTNLRHPSIEPPFIAPLLLTMDWQTPLEGLADPTHQLQSQKFPHTTSLLFEATALTMMNIMHTLIAKSVPQNLWRLMRRKRRRKQQHSFHDLSSTSRKKQQPPPQQPLRVQGIRNFGQTCFLNSVLQALSSSPIFMVYLDHVHSMTRFHHHDNGDYDDNTNNAISTLLFPLLKGITTTTASSKNGRGVDPRHLLQTIGQSHIQFRRSHEQQDAQEILQAMMDVLMEEIDHGSSGLATIAASSSDDSTDVVTSSVPYLMDKKQSDTATGCTFDAAEVHANQRSDDDEQRPPGNYVNSPNPWKQRMLASLSSTSPSPMTGWMGSTVQCAKCKHIRPIRNVPFLSLALTPTNVSKYLKGQQMVKFPSSRYPSCTVFQCLDTFCAVERVQDVCCTNCTIQSELENWTQEADMLEGAVGARPKGSSALLGLQRDWNIAKERVAMLKIIDPDQVEHVIAAPNSLEDTLPLLRCDAFKCLLLCRLPHILCLHIQRRYLAPNGQMAKTNQHVEIEEFVDFGKYNQTGLGDNKKPGIVAPYRLVSVIEHQGNSESGHYVNFRRDPSNQFQWLFVSDEVVRPVDWARVRSAQAYMLFYEAI